MIVNSYSIFLRSVVFLLLVCRYLTDQLQKVQIVNEVNKVNFIFISFLLFKLLLHYFNVLKLCMFCEGFCYRGAEINC